MRQLVKRGSVILSAAKDLRMRSLRSFAVFAAQDDGGASRRLLAFFAAVLIAASAHAGALSVSPSVVMLRGSLGQSTTQRLRIENSTASPFTFRMEAQDVVVRNGKRAFAVAGATPGSIAATAVFSQNSVTVRPGEKAYVSVTFTLPPQTSCRAVIALFRATESVQHVLASIGTLMTFATGDVVAVDSGDVRVTPQSNATNTAFAQPLVNRGTDPVLARGVVALLDAGGKLVGKSELVPVRLLPSEHNEIRGEYAGDLRPGRYRVLLTMDLQGKSMTRTAEMVIR